MMAESSPRMEDPSILGIRGAAAGGENVPPTPNEKLPSPTARAALSLHRAKGEIDKIVRETPAGSSPASEVQMLIRANQRIGQQPLRDQSRLLKHLQVILHERAKMAQRETVVASKLSDQLKRTNSNPRILKTAARAQ